MRAYGETFPKPETFYTMYPNFWVLPSGPKGVAPLQFRWNGRVWKDYPKAKDELIATAGMRKENLQIDSSVFKRLYPIGLTYREFMKWYFSYNHFDTHIDGMVKFTTHTSTECPDDADGHTVDYDLVTTFTAKSVLIPSGYDQGIVTPDYAFSYENSWVNYGIYEVTYSEDGFPHYVYRAPRDERELHGVGWSRYQHAEIHKGEEASTGIDGTYQTFSCDDGVQTFPYDPGVLGPAVYVDMGIFANAPSATFNSESVYSYVFQPSNRLYYPQIGGVIQIGPLSFVVGEPTTVEQANPYYIGRSSMTMFGYTIPGFLYSGWEFGGNIDVEQEFTASMIQTTPWPYIKTSKDTYN